LNYKTKKILKQFKAVRYVKDSGDDTSSFSDVIDCSLGVNPFGCSSLFDECKEDFFNRFNINNYPDLPYTELKKELAAYLKNICSLDESNIKFGTGSVGVLLNINRMFIERNTMVLGNCPTFTEYISDIKLNEGIYDYVLLDPDDNYKFNFDRFAKKINNKYALIYIDNPNNPTGQVIPLTLIKMIVEMARDNDVCVIIDEAYGDFMDDSNSAISLVNQYDNLMVVRSFSKAFGLAGLRVGYLVTNKAISDIYSSIDTPFTVNTAGQFAAICAMKDKEFILSSRKKIRKVKQIIVKSFKKMTVLETNNEVPIMVVKHPDKNVDLYKLFKMHHVLTEAVGLGKNFIRMRVPSDVEGIIGIIEKIEKEAI
jgi:histidinol-phosphate aminotransferase